MALVLIPGGLLFSSAIPEPFVQEVNGIVSDVLRCGGHAIGDAKRPYGFTAWIDLGDGEPIPTAIPVDAGQQAAPDAMQEIRCADHSGT